MAVIQQFLTDRLPVVALVTAGSWDDELKTWFAQHWEEFLEWASQPHVMAAVLAWIITFWVVTLIMLGLGFGPGGVIGGSFAAAFQSYMYGGFTPAGGIFATLTSMGMLGIMMPAALGLAVVVSSLVSGVVWLAGAGR